MLKTLLIAMALWSVTVDAFAQATLNLRLISTAEDRIGQQLVYAVRQEIARDPSYTVVYGEETAIRVRIITINSEAGSVRQNFTSYSLLVSLYSQNDGDDLIFEHIVGNCGQSRINSCAQSIAAEVSRAAVQIREAMSQ